jgi:hypothetical protein
LFVLTPSLEHHPQSTVAVVDLGEALQEFARAALGLIEFTLADQNDGCVGGIDELVFPLEELFELFLLRLGGRRGGQKTCARLSLP